MKKLFIVFLAISVLLGVTGVLAAGSGSQTVNAIVQQTVDFSIDDQLDFGTLSAGETSPEINNMLTVTANNNADFTLGIELTVDSSGLFSGNLMMDLDEDSETDSTALVLNTPQPVSITDPAGSSTEIHNFKAKLHVPAGFDPTVAVTGTVTYTITGITP